MEDQKTRSFLVYCTSTLDQLCHLIQIKFEIYNLYERALTCRVSVVLVIIFFPENVISYIVSLLLIPQLFIHYFQTKFYFDEAMLVDALSKAIAAFSQSLSQRSYCFTLHNPLIVS